MCWMAHNIPNICQALQFINRFLCEPYRLAGKASGRQAVQTLNSLINGVKKYGISHTYNFGCCTVHDGFLFIYMYGKFWIIITHTVSEIEGEICWKVDIVDIFDLPFKINIMKRKKSFKIHPTVCVHASHTVAFVTCITNTYSVPFWDALSKFSDKKINDQTKWRIFYTFF